MNSLFMMRRISTRRVLCLFSVISLYLLQLSAARAAIAPVETTKLENGITVVMRADRLAPRVAISLLAPAGMSDETAATAGWRRLLAESMLRASLPAKEGEGVLAARDLTRAAEKLGGEIGASVSDDALEFWIEGDSGKTAQLLDLLLQVAHRPRLAEEDVNAARARLRRRLENNGDASATSSALNALRAQLYRDAAGEPLAYGLSSDASVLSPDILNAGQLRNLHKRFFRQSTLTVSAAGDVDKSTLLELLQDVVTSPEATLEAAPPALQRPDSTQPPLQITQVEAPSAYVLIGYAFPQIDSGHPDWPALQVLSAALGQSARARLPQRLLASSPIPALPGNGQTDETVVAYQVSTQITPRRYASELVIMAQTDAQSVNAVKDAILDEVRRLQDVVLTESELKAAQNYARGNWAVSRQTPRERAFLAGLSQLNRSDDKNDTSLPARLETVTPAQAQRVARQHLKGYAVALVMPKY